ncbi:MAG: acyl-CoA dehydrogenase, partial [Leptospiraceae bacterium]|nr:acyl-CoA dehydrogenase [Leptospiraceae bacterium]
MEQHLTTIRNQFESNIKKITENLARRADEGGKLSISKMDENQLVHYNLAYHTAEFNIADYFLNYSEQNGDMEKDMASAFIGEAFNRFRGELAGRADEYGLSAGDISSLFTQELNEAIQKSVEKSKYDRIAEKVIAGEYGNPGADDYNEIRDVYRKIAEQTVMPHAEHVHRHDDFIPDDILNELVNNGAFGLS